MATHNHTLVGDIPSRKITLDHGKLINNETTISTLPGKGLKEEENELTPQEDLIK